MSGNNPMAPAQFVPLIGGEGMDYVAQQFTSGHPQAQLKIVQSRCCLQHPLCEPLMGMVDQLGLQRLEAHKAVLQAAKAGLLRRIRPKPADKGLVTAPKVGKVQLERLLQASFAFLGILDLRDVPLAGAGGREGRSSGGDALTVLGGVIVCVRGRGEGMCLLQVRGGGACPLHALGLGVGWGGACKNSGSSGWGAGGGVHLVCVYGGDIGWYWYWLRYCLILVLVLSGTDRGWYWA